MRLLFVNTLFIFVNLLYSSTAFSGIYRYEDRDGHVTYQDIPKIGLPTPDEPYLTPNSAAPPLQRTIIPQHPLKQETLPETVTYLLFFENPLPDTTLPSATDRIELTVGIQPNLPEQAFFYVTVNDQAVGPPQKSTSFNLPRLDRGTHRILLTLTDAAGQRLPNHQPVSMMLYQQRTHQ